MNKATRIALLRGINVGGKNILPMARLREMAISLGYKSVQTYIQSGNLFFESSRSATKLASELALAIESEFNFSVPTIVLTGPKLTDAVEKNPWPNVAIKALHLGVLSQKPTQKQISAIPNIDSGDDQWHCDGRFVYFYCPNGLARTKLTNTFFERHLSCKMTVRNWKTTQKLIELISKPKEQ
ncbi:MAG: DUF1697 domain-containing protein [Planctomycetota bacterium]